jgi:large subunit ribosomal protein L24
MAARIKKDDRVIVIAGADKGTEGKVLRVLPDKQRVLVEGVNRVHRHVRKSQRHPQGGRIQKEAPIHISNVMPVDPKTGRGTRVRFVTKRDASGAVVKQRVCGGRQGSGEVLGDIRRAARETKGGNE